jgi:uncharacterized protein YaiI (UPF0178 family)
VRDYAEVKGNGEITMDMADRALRMLDVDTVGFDVMDRKLLEAVLFKFGGGPVGIGNLAAAIGEAADTIEDVLEPYLIQQGYLQRTPRGRIATPLAYQHFGVAAPRISPTGDLWDNLPPDLTRLMQIWVDADACPGVIKDILFRVAERLEMQVTLVANQLIRVPGSRFIRALQVPSGADVADTEIVERLAPGDLVVTGDIPLAARVLEKGGDALNPRGDFYTKDNIAQQLTMRAFMEELRSGGVDTGGPAMPSARPTASRPAARFATMRSTATWPGAAARSRSWATTAAGARATKLSLDSLPLALAISPSMRAISFDRRSRSAATSISTFSISLVVPTIDTAAGDSGSASTICTSDSLPSSCM